MKLLRFFPVLFLFADACIERYDLPAQIAEPRLVVNGMITNLPGPYTIELYISSDLNTNLNKPTPVSNAKVRIADDAGNEELLVEKSPGVYETRTDGMQGTVGRKYHTIIDVQEKHYRSQPQELTAAGEISDVRYDFQLGAINRNEPAKAQDVLNVYIDSKGVPGQTNLFRWRWSSTHEVKTFPELRTREFGRPPVVIPDPLPCSGYVPGPAGTIRKVDICTCCSCWVSEYSQQASVSNNQAVKADQFNSVYIAKIPVDHWRFSIKYYMKIEQFSLSQEAYNFWNLVQSQQEGEGSLFQPNSVKVKGNIYSTTDDEEVLGFFGVSGVTQKEFFIDRRQVPSKVDIKNDTVKGSCLGQFTGSTNRKPLFW
ncbi:MAG TPA: DUF4249 domain-containing protein [Chryseosolibacter sp.]